MQAIEVTGTTLYQADLRTYTLLRYGVDVQTSVAAPHKTVHLIDWGNPAANDFALAEEVTLKGGHERRPDLVVYLNGVAVAVIELKRSSRLRDGQPRFPNQWNSTPFFATASFCGAEMRRFALALARSARPKRCSSIGGMKTRPPETCLLAHSSTVRSRRCCARTGCSTWSGTS